MRKPWWIAVLPLIVAGALGTYALRGADEVAVAAADPSPGDPRAELERAEALVEEGSYGLAHEIYAALEAAKLPEEDARWVEFRLADTAWRSRAATQASDASELEAAPQQLQRLVRDVTRVEDRDRVWVEVQESLGDYAWVRRDQPNWGQAWQHYQQALDWWAGSREIDLARERYLAIVWRAARPPHVPPHYYYGYYGNQLPLPILESALEIAVDPRDQAQAQYLIAMNLRQQWGDPAWARRTDAAFRQAIEDGRSTEWYDDALYHYAEWLARAGKTVRLDGGGYQHQPDYVGALQVFRRLVRELGKGETRYYDPARQQIETISGPAIGVAVSNVFLPGSEVQYHLSWRNVDEVRLSAYPVELNRDLQFSGEDDKSQWLSNLARSAGTPVRSWTHATGDGGDHVPGQEALVLDEGLPPGAYLLEAQAAGEQARDLLLVTRSALVLKSSGRQALAFVCDAVDGSPRTDAEVVLWIRHYHEDWRWTRLTGRTDREGLLPFELPDSENRVELFAVSSAEEDQAFSPGQVYGQRPAREDWRVYVFTDRPAYRPDETVQWKVIARGVRNGDYVTPSERKLRYRITDPRGTRLEEGALDLNDYGSAWASLKLGAELPLGQYRIEFREAERDRHIGGAELFRMEEYKLPEFKVSVATPEDEDGRPKTFRVGEEIEAQISAEYYFGGPVGGAQVEAVIYQKPLFVWWQPPREFPWFYEDMSPGSQRWWGGPGQVVDRRTVHTDEQGRAIVRVETPAASGQDFEYTVEARVTDASRREVVGQGSVRVSRQRYFAFARTQHQLYRPQDRVRVELKTIDANQRPLPAEGRVRVTRDRWVETWISPAGREVGGSELDKIRRRDSVFPPPPERPGDPAWRLQHQGYEHEEVLTRLIRTGDDGTAELDFTPERDGFYRVTWSGDEMESWPVAAETTVWVADPATTEIGYRHGGVQILVDRDTLRAGGTTPLMLSAPVQGAWILFSVEGEELYDYRLVHLDGTVKLLELPIGENYVPNVFFEAAMVHDGELLLDSRQVVVPPVQNFLEVQVSADREHYEPGESGRLDVTTRDHEGNPVSAEVALALVDDSIFYIQQDLAGDPRQFFYGQKRAKRVSTQSTFNYKPYARLAQGPEGQVVDHLVPGARYDYEGDDKDEYRAKREVAKTAAQALGLAGAKGRMAADAVALEEAAAPLVSSEIAERAGGGPGAGGAVQVRSDFRSTAIWQPHLVTGADGRASLELKFPDSLTTWRATSRVVGRGNRFGLAETTARTRKPLIVRLQAPRFFVVGDEVTLSAVIHNNTDAPLSVAAELAAEGLDLLGLIRRDGTVSGHTGSITVAARGEARLDWRAAARAAGETTLTVEARAGEFADAMRKGYSVYEHGVDKLLFRAGKVRGDDVRVRLDLPDARRPGSTEMTVQVTPSMAVTLLDALPYLIDYPYGCTEQTMSRFLPSVITARTLESLGLERELVAGRIFGGIEQEFADKTQPKGKQDLDRLNDMVRKGLDRLYDFQHADGGWGWWKEGDSDHFMTAYVVWGLGLARDAGIQVREDPLRRGLGFLDGELVEEEERPDMQAWMLHAMASVSKKQSAYRFQRQALENLWGRRDRLNAYTRALLALAAHDLGDDQKAGVLVRNLANGVKRDRSPDTSVIVRGGQAGSDAVIGTAHWGEDGIYWRWSSGPVESTAFALRALMIIDPGNELIEPVTNWLVKNRRGAQWSNTRDTAIAVLALSDYLRTSGELTSELEYELEVNGTRIARRRIRPADILGAPSRFAVDPGLVRDGANEIRIVRTSGSGPIYFAAEARFFSLEEPVTPAGNEIFVRRSYYRIVSEPTLLKGYLNEKRGLPDGGAANSGERVEVVLTLEAKNDYEYLVVEDLKPAGLEAVQIRSGEPLYARQLKSVAFERSDAEREAGDYTGRSRWVYQELRDRKVALFIDKLPQGVWEMRYELRAEVPGAFHALPALVHAMYVPEIRANGHELRMQVIDVPE